MLVILDPGHAAGVAGKRSPDGRLREYKWAREITGMLEKELDALQIQHVRSTPPSEDEDKEPGLTLRCQRANKAAKTIRKVTIIHGFATKITNKSVSSMMAWQIIKNVPTNHTSFTLIVEFSYSLMRIPAP